MTLTILQDNKEKIPWDLTFYGLNQKRVHLATGDYALEDYISSLTIERKRTAAEIAGNLGTERKRFEAELLRMAEFRFRFLICEFTSSKLAAFPKGAKIPRFLKRRIRVRGKYLLKRLTELCEEHGIILIFAGNTKQAEMEAVRILTESYEVLQSE